MSEFEIQLVKEVRKYGHLYDPLHADYKDVSVGLKSWTEISKVVGEQVCECTRRWKNLRDKYVRTRKKMRHSDPTHCRKTRVPSYFKELSWLAPYVKHRGATEDDDEEERSGENATAEATAVSETASPQLPSADGARHTSTFPPPKRKRVEDLESRLQSQVAKLEERRAQLEQQQQQQRQQQQQQQQRTSVTALTAVTTDEDELVRFGQTVVDMLRRVPEDLRPEAMFEVHKILFEKQKRPKQTAAPEVS